MPAPHEIAAFIGSSFRSVWSLELLSLLRSDRLRSLPHDEMVTRLRGSDLVVRQSLEGLVAAGLAVVERDGSARYQPVGPELDSLVKAAELLYIKSPDQVRRMIVSAHTSDLAAFANSFRLRKD